MGFLRKLFGKGKNQVKQTGEPPNRILAIAVVGNGFVPSENVVNELLRYYGPDDLHPQAKLRAQRGGWANRDEMPAVATAWIMGFCQFPIVTSSFGSHKEIGECLQYREMRTIEGDCLVVQLYERPPS